MISYPAELPRPSQNYSLDIENSNVRTRMDSGRIRQRRRFTASQNAISVRWDFTDEEFQYFESFAFLALNGGNDWFETEVLTGGGIVTQTVRLQGGKYKAAYKGFMGWVVSATLDVQEINRLDANTLADKLYPIEEMQSELDYIVNTQLPTEVGTPNE